MLFAIDGPPLSPVYIGHHRRASITGSLYVSTLCSSGLRALTVSGPAILIVFLPLGRSLRPFRRRPHCRLLDGSLLAGLLLLALRFAFENHRSAGRDFTRVGRQLLVMAALVVALLGRF